MTLLAKTVCILPSVSHFSHFSPLLRRALAGIPVIGVLSTQGPKALTAVGAKLTVDTFKDVMALIEKQFAS